MTEPRRHLTPTGPRRRHTPFRTMIVLALFLLAGLAGWPRGGAAEIGISEYKMKAIFIYRFIDFVKWPGEDGPNPKEVVIGILGEDPFQGAFAPVADKPLPGKSYIVRVRRLGAWRPGMDLSGVQILFIAASEQENISPILSSLSGKPVLTISDTDRFLERGGMINLLTVDQKVCWEINRRPVAKARLELNSQILRLATRVVNI